MIGLFNKNFPGCLLLKQTSEFGKNTYKSERKRFANRNQWTLRVGHLDLIIFNTFLLEEIP